MNLTITHRDKPSQKEYDERFLRNGYEVRDFKLPTSLLEDLKKEKWNEVDRQMAKLLSPKGSLFQLLSTYKNFDCIEHIVAIRNPPDDEGIWHDDGSRKLAFSLSLTEFPSLIKGGALHIRKKGSSNQVVITPRPLGKLIIFQTGHGGYEHKVSAVKAGRRVICAGWCT